VTATMRRSIPRKTVSTGEGVITALVGGALLYSAQAWASMLVLGGLHSWDPRIPAVPFWPALGLWFLFGQVVGFVAVSVRRINRTGGDR